MYSFHSNNPIWSKSKWAAPGAEGGWRLPDDVSLAEILDLTLEQRIKFASANIAQLRLQGRLSIIFSSLGVQSAGRLFGLTLTDVSSIPGMGIDATCEVVTALFHFIRPAPLILSWSDLDVDPQNYQPLTLRQDWELFSGGVSCSEAISLSEISRFHEIRVKLQEIGVLSLGDLLNLNFSRLCEITDFDSAEAALTGLTEYAADVKERQSPWRQSTHAQDRGSLLASRMGWIGVSELNLTETAARALRRAQVTTVSELLDALDPLHAELALDVFAFAEIWAAVQSLGLREEAWETAAERLIAEAHGRVTLDHIAHVWREMMTPQQWPVLSARFGLELSKEDMAGESVSARGKPTLDDIATTLGLTRERVRQIELKAVLKLTRPPHDYLIALQHQLMVIIALAGGIISVHQAAEDLGEWIDPGGSDAEGFCRLVFHDNSRVFAPVKKNSVYAIASQPHHFYEPIVNAASNKVRSSPTELSLDDLADVVVQELFSGSLSSSDANIPRREFVLACLQASGIFQAERYLAMDVLLIRILREIGAPQHFTDLTEYVNESGLRKRQASAKYVQNCLIVDRELFVYVAPGTYGLTEWGMEDRRVGRSAEVIGDLAIEYLESKGVPDTVTNIAAYVLARKSSKYGSVAQRLYYDERFQRHGKDKYVLSKWTF